MDWVSSFIWDAYSVGVKKTVIFRVKSTGDFLSGGGLESHFYLRILWAVRSLMAHKNEGREGGTDKWIRGGMSRNEWMNDLKKDEGEIRKWGMRTMNEWGGMKISIKDEEDKCGVQMEEEAGLDWGMGDEWRKNNEYLKGKDGLVDLTMQTGWVIRLRCGLDQKP